jgi:AraC family transcriptional regulator of adaptative response/methylated-DNA-[protein]-cysteine methyltransferase
MSLNIMTVNDATRIAHAIRYLDANSRRQPDLDEIAKAVNLSRYHFQRLFRRWAGISPKRFLQVVTLSQAKRLLQEKRSVLDTALDVGMSGPGRLHDLFISMDGVSPGEFKERGAGLTLDWGIYPSPFGDCLLVASPRGICSLSFLPDGVKAGLAEVRAKWPRATLHPDGGKLKGVASRIFSPARSGAPLTLHLQGTNFQVQVWQALLRVPFGEVVTYGDVARSVGKPAAVRAVGTAVGHNPVAFLIPCHRVIRETGALGEYHWGPERKRAMQVWEAARRETA